MPTFGFVPLNSIQQRFFKNLLSLNQVAYLYQSSVSQRYVYPILWFATLKMLRTTKGKDRLGHFYGYAL